MMSPAQLSGKKLENLNEYKYILKVNKKKDENSIRGRNE
jgi:hypothetical protein